MQDEYPGYGRCIYCGNNGGADGLRDEHTIPFSLGGKVVIKKASCKACEAITSYLDGYLARHVFFEHRLRTGAPTRRPKQRPETIAARFAFTDGEQRIIALPIEKAPSVLAMPVWGPPGILAGLPPRIGFPRYMCHAYGFLPADMRETLGLQEGEKARPTFGGTIIFHTFARAIAKIAYCNALIRFGRAGFRPLALPQMVRGIYPCIPYFVGADIEDPPPPDRGGPLHKVGFADVTIGRMRLMVIAVRLFANNGTEERGMPIYYVVTGARHVH